MRQGFRFISKKDAIFGFHALARAAIKPSVDPKRSVTTPG